MKELGEGPVAERLGGDLRGREARERPGGARIVRKPENDGDALRGEPRAAILDQRLVAAEQMGDARNVEHEPVGAVERGERGESRAPVAQALEKPRLFRRRGLERQRARESGRARRRAQGLR